jgi:hypothetical protein
MTNIELYATQVIPRAASSWTIGARWGEPGAEWKPS